MVVTAEDKNTAETGESVGMEGSRQEGGWVTAE